MKKFIAKALLVHSRFLILFVLSIHSSTSHSNVKPSRKQECERFSINNADLDSLRIYPELNFKAKWTRDKHFWKSSDFDFEARYIKETKHGSKGNILNNLSNKNPKGPPQVNVFVLPFSHNDPGWKETYETYFYSFTKKILTNAIDKLSEYKNMTFAWSEVSFLSKWWEEASYIKKEGLRRLVKEGRFEILTGGWVMADEATTTVFALVNQLIEGHQWIKKHLNIVPTSAWSIDAFGHSSTMPYILKKSDIKGMMIQRVHYAWKHWFGEHREGDFLWIPRWSMNPEKDGIVCHNAHYDLYPTKHSCGPNPNVCMKFDFRVLDGIREEHIAHMQKVETKNLRMLVDSLTGQYRRTASLTKHNVVTASLGGDFRFDHLSEWDQQYKNYNLLFNYINSRKNDYHTSAQFGTLSDYFKGVQDSNVTLSTFSGDFFPYADILFPFAPGHWTGYYGTRPFWKKLCRETEDELLKAEILFTFAYNLLIQHNFSSEVLYRNYDNLVYARRSVALFQHHDGITGTSPRKTMLDYSRKLTQAWNFCRQIQRLAIESIWRKHLNIPVPPLITETQRRSYTTPSAKVPVKLYANANIVKKVLIFNSLAWKRSQLVRMAIVTDKTSNLIVKGPNGNSVLAQISKRVQTLQDNENTYELSFVAELPPLSVVTFEVCRKPENDARTSVVRSILSCKICNHDDGVQDLPAGAEIALDNDKIKAYFDTDLGLLKRIEGKNRSRIVNANLTLTFGRYDAIYGSGAYLLHPFSSSSQWSLNSSEAAVYVVRGPVMSEVTLVTPRITLKSWVLHVGSPETISVVYMSLHVNATISDSFGEHFMRFQSDLNNTASSSSPTFTFHEKHNPVFFTDTNGLSVEKRVTLSKLPYQANHFPITKFAFIQDTTQSRRLSLLVDRSHGVSSLIRGRLEVLFDRRLRYDDARGMEEGVMDVENAMSNYIVALEEAPENDEPTHFSSWEPSITVQKLSMHLNHQPTIFVYDALSTHKNGEISLFSHPFPDDVHLLNLQTLSGTDHLEDIKSAPSTKALLILQRLGHYHNKPNNAVSSRTEKDCNQQQDTLLNSTTLINHSVKRTNLVGTKEDDDNNNSTISITTTKRIPIGGMHELSPFLIQF